MPAILDLANNPLQLADATAKLIAKLSEEAEGPPLSIYKMLNASLRDADARVGLFLAKRLVGGFEQEWAKLEAGVRSLRVLRSVADAPDEILRYLQLHLGWTDDLLPITTKLSDDKLRALLAASPGIWRTRGQEVGYSGIMLAAMDFEYVFDWDYFTLRWVCDENAFGEDRRGRDVWIIDLPGPPNYDDRQSNLRIVDPSGKADRDLAHDLVNLFRPMNERVTITWLEFADRFTSDRGWSSGTYALGSLTIDGQTALAPSSRADNLGGHLAYVRCLVTSSGAPSAFSVVFRYVDADNCYLATMSLTDNRLTLVVRTGGVDSTLQSFDFGDISETLTIERWYGLRVEVLPFGANQLIRVYVDGELRISSEDATHLSGRWGISSLADTVLSVTDVEMMPSPGETTEVP